MSQRTYSSTIIEREIKKLLQFKVGDIVRLDHETPGVSVPYVEGCLWKIVSFSNNQVALDLVSGKPDSRVRNIIEAHRGMVTCDRSLLREVSPLEALGAQAE